MLCNVWNLIDAAIVNAAKKNIIYTVGKDILLPLIIKKQAPVTKVAQVSEVEERCATIIRQTGLCAYLSKQTL